MEVTLNLVVLRCADPARSAAFYEALLGVKFVTHRHGRGPEHWTAGMGGCVFELYPASEARTEGVRIGFSVPSLDSALANLAEGQIRSGAADSEWGRRAVVLDLDGHVIELLERNQLCPSSAQMSEARIKSSS